MPQKSKRSQIFEGTPQEAAAQVDRETAFRSEGHMSGILAVLEQREGKLHAMSL